MYGSRNRTGNRCCRLRNQDSVLAVWWICLQPSKVASNFITVGVQWVLLALWTRAMKRRIDKRLRQNILIKNIEVGPVGLQDILILFPSDFLAGVAYES